MPPIVPRCFYLNGVISSSRQVARHICRLSVPRSQSPSTAGSPLAMNEAKLMNVLTLLLPLWCRIHPFLLLNNLLLLLLLLLLRRRRARRDDFQRRFGELLKALGLFLSYQSSISFNEAIAAAEADLRSWISPLAHHHLPRLRKPESQA